MMFEVGDCVFHIFEEGAVELIKCNSEFITFEIPEYVEFQGKRYFIKVIEEFAFKDCKKMKYITFSPNSKVETLSDYAFSLNKHLERVSLPKSIKYFYLDAFHTQSSFEIESGCEILVTNEDGCLYRKRNRCLISDSKKSKRSHLIIREGIENILSNAFLGDIKKKNEKMKYVCFPSSLQSIGQHSFSEMSEIRVSFPCDSKLQKIGKDAFAFTVIKIICFPSSLVAISHRAFYECHLKSITFPANSKLEVIEKLSFAENDIITIKFPESLKFLGTHSFGSCLNLVAIIFSDKSNLNEIGADPFVCSPVNRVICPDKLKPILMHSNTINEIFSDY